MFALRALVGLTGEGAQARTGWIHVAPEGSWEGHPDGAFTLTTAGFESCIYDAERRATPQSVDYEHASLYPTGEPTPAAGYAFMVLGVAAIVATWEPAAAVLFGYVLFGERLEPAQWLGTACILGAVLLLRPGG